MDSGSFKRLDDAIQYGKEHPDLILLRNNLQSDYETGDFVARDAQQIMQLFRRSLESQRCCYNHEVINQFSKVFFDIDLVIPQGANDNERIEQVCKMFTKKESLYVASLIPSHGSALEHCIIGIIQRAIVRLFYSTFGSCIISESSQGQIVGSLDPLQSYNRKSTSNPQRDCSQRECTPPTSQSQVFLRGRATGDEHSSDFQFSFEQVDRLFDKYRCSRQVPVKKTASKSERHEYQFKVSWHLVMCPSTYYMHHIEQKHLAGILKNIVQYELYPILQAIRSEYPSFDYFGDIIDTAVYRKGSMRLFTQAKDEKTQMSMTKKLLVQACGIVVGSNDHLFQQNTKWYASDELSYIREVAEDMPHRVLLSRITRADGSPLKLLSDHTSFNVLYSDLNECPVVQQGSSEIDYGMIKKALFKQNMLNADVIEERQLGNLHIIKIRCHIDICPICKRIHENENMFAIVNPRMETIELRCFRKGPKARGIKLNFEGFNYFSEYDISNGLLYEDALQDEQKDSRGISKKIVPSALKQMVETYNASHMVTSLHYNAIPRREYNQQEIEAFPKNFSRLYVKSHMGTGKTKQLANFLVDFVTQNPAASIYILTFRVSFGLDLRKKLNAKMQEAGLNVDFANYKTLKDRPIDKQYLLIQIESLNRLISKRWQCDLLIMDESESIYEQLTSQLSPKESTNFSIFKTLVRKSNRVICMDAYLSPRTVDLTESFARNDSVSLYNRCNQQETNPALCYENVVFYNNQWQREKNFVVYNKSGKRNLWLSDLIEAVGDGARVVVPCNNARVAHAIYEILASKFPDKKDANKIQVYTQELNKAQRETDILNVNQTWKSYDVLIYSPTISAGISFEVEHFDRVFAYYDIGITTLETMFQMLGRVRTVSSNTYHIVLAGQSKRLPSTLKAVHEDVVQNILNACAQVPSGVFYQFEDEQVMFTNNDFYQVVLHNTLSSNLSYSSPTLRFYAMIGTKANVTLRSTLPDSKFGVTLESMIRSINTEDFNTLMKAQVISDEQAFVYRQQQILSPAEHASLRKYDLFKQLEITADQANLLDDFKTMRDVRIWQQKIEYLNMRLTHTTVRKCKDTTVTQILTQMFHQDSDYTSSSDFKLNNQSPFRALELILQTMGMNQDILNPHRFVQGCLHQQSCRCIMVPVCVSNAGVEYLIKDAVSQKQIITLLNSARIPSATLTTALKLTTRLNGQGEEQKIDISERVKLVKRALFSILRSQFGLAVSKALGDEVYILKHSDRFDQYLHSRANTSDKKGCLGLPYLLEPSIHRNTLIYIATASLKTDDYSLLRDTRYDFIRECREGENLTVKQLCQLIKESDSKSPLSFKEAILLLDYNYYSINRERILNVVDRELQSQ